MTLFVVALMLCSTATASAAFLITGKQIKDGTLTGRDVRDHSLTGKDITGAVRGATGPAGPVGAVGTTGPVGPTGPVAISGPVVVSSPFTIAPFTSVDVSAPCPAGTVAVGGGASTGLNAGEIEQSAPTDVAGTGWTVSVYDPTPGNVSASVTAVCVTAH